jgi:hypothetical protein
LQIPDCPLSLLVNPLSAFEVLDECPVICPGNYDWQDEERHLNWANGPSQLFQAPEKIRNSRS